MMDFLLEPETRSLAVDTDDRLKVHQKILNRKKSIRGVFTEFYQEILKLDQKYLTQSAGTNVELGAGVSFFKSVHPKPLLVTDVAPHDNMDRILDAQKMDLPDASVRAVYGINCFHHFPEPDLFFQSLERVLQNGGGCILIEPYYGPFASWLYKRLFKSEHFDPEQIGWSMEPAQQGIMSGANQALSYLVFVRDRDAFHARYPQLNLEYSAPLRNGLSYLVSGGLNFRPLIPSWAFSILKILEHTPLARLFALHHVLVLRKTHVPV